MSDIRSYIYCRMYIVLSLVFVSIVLNKNIKLLIQFLKVDIDKDIGVYCTVWRSKAAKV